MKNFPKTIYVTMIEVSDDEPSEYFVNDSKEFAETEDENTLVAVYQLVKIGQIVKSSKIVFG
jgi:hypothetical protein